MVKDFRKEASNYQPQLREQRMLLEANMSFTQLLSTRSLWNSWSTFALKYLRFFR